MSDVVSFLNDLIWGSVLVYLLVAVGLYFTIRLKFIQFRHFAHTFSVMRNSRKTSKEGISSFQALTVSLAARVGTGNLAGVAVAITLGGPGAIFWMWLIALLGMATSFAESTLAQMYKTKDDEGKYRGGPAYYMKTGLGMGWMGVLFSIFLIISFGLAFNAVQANSIAQAMNVAFGVPPWLVGITLVVLTGVIIFGGLRSIARFAEIVVPVMAVAYLLVAAVVVVMNITEIPSVLAYIVKSALGLEQAAGGAVGYGIAQAMVQGIKRGLFSNEAGMGSAPNAAATATPHPNHPASQGYVQMLGVFIDTIIICTATASIILLSGEFDPASGVTGIELTQNAISSQVGGWGSTFIAIAIFFFAFTSIVANYSYAETNLVYLEQNHMKGLVILRIVVLGMVMAGSIGELPLFWAIADVSMGLMALVNLVAILLLSKIVIKLAKDYNMQLDAGESPTFHREKYPELEGHIAPGVWEKEDEK